MALAIGNFDAQVQALTLLAQTWLRVGSTSAPTNVTAGDLTATRLFIPNVALGSETRLFQLTDTWTPAGGAFHSMGVEAKISPGAGAASDEYRAAAFDITVSPTASFAGAARAFNARYVHEAGAFNVAIGTGFFGQVVQNLAGTATTIGRAGHLVYRALAGGITTAEGLFIERGVTGDAGTITTGIGILIQPSTGVIPTTDITISALGAGAHMRHEGSVVIGANASPSAATVGLYLTQLMAQSGSSITVGVDGSAPRVVLAAMDGTNEGGELLINGAAANVDWTLDNNAGALRFFESGVVRAQLYQNTSSNTGLSLSGFLRLGSASRPTTVVSPGDLSMSGRLTTTPSTQQSIAVSAAIVADATVVQISTTTAANMTATPTVANGVDGQIIIIVNTGVNTFTLQDQGTLAGSNLRLSAAGVALATRDSIMCMYSSSVGDWIQISQTNVI